MISAPTILFCFAWSGRVTSFFFDLLDASQRKQGIGKISRIGWVVLRVIITRPDHLKIGFFIVVAFGIPRIAETFRLE